MRRRPAALLLCALALSFAAAAAAECVAPASDPTLCSRRYFTMPRVPYQGPLSQSLDAFHWYNPSQLFDGKSLKVRASNSRAKLSRFLRPPHKVLIPALPPPYKHRITSGSPSCGGPPSSVQPP